jgi:hypothetical protein
MALTPLQLIDDFLVSYNVGQALLVVFVLSVLGVLPLNSRKALSLLVVTFGVVFMATPSSLAPFQYRLLGIGLLMVGPVVYVTGRR